MKNSGLEVHECGHNILEDVADRLNKNDVGNAVTSPNETVERIFRRVQKQMDNKDALNSTATSLWKIFNHVVEASDQVH